MFHNDAQLVQLHYWTPVTQRAILLHYQRGPVIQWASPVIHLALALALVLAFHHVPDTYVTGRPVM